MVVEDAQGDGSLPAAAGREDLQPAVVEIAVPQRADVLGFVASVRPRKRLAQRSPVLFVKEPLEDEPFLLWRV